jgi:nucleotide-binding universal stress UspA family protein
MASHGRSDIASLLLGSVTHKVLAHAKIPVVVFR